MIQLILPLLKFPLEAPGRGTWEGRTTHVGCRSHQQNGTYDPVFHSPKTFDQNGDQFDNAVKANNKCSPGKRIWRLAAHRMCWKKQWRRSCFASSATQPSVNLDNHWCLVTLFTAIETNVFIHHWLSTCPSLCLWKRMFLISSPGLLSKSHWSLVIHD